jgi:hypothetical protein
MLAPTVQDHELHFLTNTKGWKNEDEGHRTEPELASDARLKQEDTSTAVVVQQPVLPPQSATGTAEPSKGESVTRDSADSLEAAASAAASLASAAAEMFRSQLVAIQSSDFISLYFLFIIAFLNLSDFEFLFVFCSGCC